MNIKLMKPLIWIILVLVLFAPVFGLGSQMVNASPGKIVPVNQAGEGVNQPAVTGLSIGILPSDLPNANVPVDGSFILNVKINSAVNLNSWQFDLNFAMNVVRVAGSQGGPGVAAGQIGSTVMPIDSWAFQPPADTGWTIRVLGHLSGNTSVSGSGNLAQVTFNVVGPVGTFSLISLTNIGLYDIQGVPITPVNVDNTNNRATVSTVNITTTSPLATGEAGLPYLLTLAADGGATPYTWTAPPGALPAGLSLSANGTISGTPTAVFGPADILFSVSDALGHNDNANLSLTVLPVLNITSGTPLASGEVNLPYSLNLAVSGGSPPYNWSVQPGLLPTGLSLSSDGLISGTPTSAGGPFNVIINVTDDLGANAANNFSIIIHARLTITTLSPLPAGEANAFYSQTLGVAGGSGPYAWTLRNGTLPAGLSLSVGGVISGTPAASGSPVNILVRATDSLGGTDERSYILIVYPQGYSAGEVLLITGHSPIDIVVTDPDGLKISKLINQIPGATYIEADLDNDGDLEDQVIIPDRKLGYYGIAVVPALGALPSDTYSLDVSISGTSLVIVNNARVGNIPSHGYGIDSTNNGITQRLYSVPALSIWGALGLMVILGGILFWVLKNKREKAIY